MVAGGIPIENEYAADAVARPVTAGFVFALGVKDEYAGDVVYVYRRDDYAEDVVLF